MNKASATTTIMITIKYNTDMLYVTTICVTIILWNKARIKEMIECIFVFLFSRYIIWPNNYPAPIRNLKPLEERQLGIGIRHIMKLTTILTTISEHIIVFFTQC